MPPANATTYQYCTAADVEILLSDDGVVGRLDDDASGTANSAEQAHLTRAIQWATGRCNLYLLTKHAAADLAQSWIVNEWCTILAAHIISIRRGNPAAASLAEVREAAIEDMKLVQSGQVVLADTAVRDSCFPAWSNLGAPHLGYRLRKLRVQTGISGKKGDRSGQTIDRAAEVIEGYENH